MELFLIYPGCRYALPLAMRSLGFAFPFSRRPLVQRDKRKSWVKWQPAFRLVKVVFVVVNRQHRVHNQTVVPVVVKTKARQLQTWTSELGYSIFLHIKLYTLSGVFPSVATAAFRSAERWFWKPQKGNLFSPAKKLHTQCPVCAFLHETSLI